MPEWKNLFAEFRFDCQIYPFTYSFFSQQNSMLLEENQIVNLWIHRKRIKMITHKKVIGRKWTDAWNLFYVNNPLTNLLLRPSFPLSPKIKRRFCLHKGNGQFSLLCVAITARVLIKIVQPHICVLKYEKVQFWYVASFVFKNK